MRSTRAKLRFSTTACLTPGWVAGYLKASGAGDHAIDNLTHEELDQVIDFMIERKRAGQFRAIWEDYGQCVNLLASGEVWLADAWNPVVEDVKKQGVVCKYATPKEGFTAWFHGVAVPKTRRTSRRRLIMSTSVSKAGGVHRSRRRVTTRRQRPAKTTSKQLQHQRGVSTTTTGGTRAASPSRNRAGRSTGVTPAPSRSAGGTSCTG